MQLMVVVMSGNCTSSLFVNMSLRCKCLFRSVVLLMIGSVGSESHICILMMSLLYWVIRMWSCAVVRVRLLSVIMLSLCNVGIYLTAVWECLLVGRCHLMLCRRDIRWFRDRDAGCPSARVGGCRSRGYVGRMWCCGGHGYVRSQERWTKYAYKFVMAFYTDFWMRSCFHVFGLGD